MIRALGSLTTLERRLGVVLVGLFAVVGAGVLAASLLSHRLFLEEVDQRLHRDLAAQLVKEDSLMIDGQVQAGALDHVFHLLMVINPRIEVYLLDTAGRVLEYHAPPGRVQLERIDLEPVRRYLAGDPLPLRGTDPRAPGEHTIFSAAPIFDGGDGAGEQQGFLYVILGGERYKALSGRLWSSYVLRLWVGLLVALIAISIFVGLVLFRRLTRRLRDLDESMAAFGEQLRSRARSDEPDGSLAKNRTPEEAPQTLVGDELDRLGATFESMQARIDAQVRSLREVDRLRRELVTNVSHDLRTPVTVLRGDLETLLMRDESLTAEDRRHYLSTALAQSERLGDLVSELFELSRLDSGDTPIEREPFSAAELAQDVVQKVANRAREAGVHLQAELDAATPLVDGDLRLIERVLENLIHNALRHTEPGGSLRVGVREHLGGVRIEIEDSGCGIAPDDLPHVFQRWYRGRASDLPGEGAGLGLAIAKKVVELHDSEIKVESEPGVGTTFRFDLGAARRTQRAGGPAALVAPTPAPSAASPEAAARSSAAS